MVSLSYTKYTMNSILMFAEAMYPVCPLHNIKLYKLVEEQKFYDGEVLAASENFMLTNPPYNSRSVRGNENSTEDILASVDMKAMSKLCSEMLRPAAQVHTFCSVLQFGQWYRILSKKARSQQGTGLSGSDSDRGENKKQTSEFDLESISLHDTCIFGTYNSSPAGGAPRHIITAGKAILFWRMKFSRKEVLAPSSTQSYVKVPTTFIWWTNKMNRISQVPADARAVVSDDTIVVELVNYALTRRVFYG